jgi:2-oxoglutarate dehydrogenase E1 component
VDDLTHGRFHRVIPDAQTEPAKVKRVLLCAGKVYYDLLDARRKLARDDIAIIRLEQLYPFNHELLEALAPYAPETPLVWVQEEPRNAGPWYYINANLPPLLAGRWPLSLVSRPASASPATGSKASHDFEQERLLSEALA